MEIFIIVVLGIIGASVGSFINVCADRLPEGRSIVSPPSHCDGCRRRLTAPDLVPVFSYLVLRGRCRTCGAKIPLRVFWVELGCGLFTAFLVWYKGLTLEMGFIAFYSYLFILIALIDLKHQLILNKIVYPMLIVALVIAPFFINTGIVREGIIDYGLVNALIGGVSGFIVLLVPAVVTRGGMGFGDVKLAALIGLATGFGNVFVAVLGGIILGGLAAVFLLVFRIKKRKEVIPFGPFLSLATIITLIWGSGIMDWWLNLFVR